MRVRYTIPFKTKVIIDDHWEVPMQGGKLRVVEEEGYANALELVFERQPLEYAPRIQNHAEGKIAMTITKRDLRIGFVKYQFDNVAAFLKCTYDVELMTEDIETKYEGENPDEEQQIKVKSFGNGRREIPFPLPFDVLTRAVMAAENKDGPRFEATLVATARSALAQQEFINSFRYSFLLMESLYGEGQFKKAGLQGAFKRN